MKKYIVKLTDHQRQRSGRMVERGKAKGYKIRHARILLLVDQGEWGPGWTDRMAAESLGININTVWQVRKRFVLKGFWPALGRRYRTNYPCKIDNNVKARLIAIACSEPPEGHEDWTYKLLAEKLVELKIVDSVSCMTICNAMQNTGLGEM